MKSRRTRRAASPETSSGFSKFFGSLLTQGDLSRFGRDYIESGKYIEKIFPALGIRFIAINDNYDSAANQQAGNEIILPFKNLINDSYSRDISIKVRSNLDIKRRNGEFVGNHAIYGYQRSEENKNQLVIDKTAAPVVESIFRMKIDGFSPAQIADLSLIHI